MCQMGCLKTDQRAGPGRTNSHKKLVSTVIGRVRDFFHELHLKLYLCLLCCQRRLPGFCGNRVQMWHGFVDEGVWKQGRNTAHGLNLPDRSRHNPSPYTPNRLLRRVPSK